jgi:ribosomal protein L15E
MPVGWSRNEKGVRFIFRLKQINLTPFSWLKLKSPIVIYDANVRKALQLNTSCGYAEYLERWRDEYEHLSNKIDRACRGLTHAQRYVIDSNVLSAEEFESLTQKRWFKERVLDMFLWFRGA